MENEEKKTLVTSEGEIKAGDLLEFVDSSPLVNGKRLVTKVIKAPGMCLSTKGHESVNTHSRKGFLLAPSSIGDLPYLIGVLVSKRKVYRIDTGLLDEESPYTAAKVPSKERP